MFKNHKLELRLKKDNNEVGLEEVKPSITKEDILHISKKIAHYVIGGTLLVLATSAVIDTGRYAAIVRIDNQYVTEED